MCERKREGKREHYAAVRERAERISLSVVRKAREISLSPPADRSSANPAKKKKKKERRKDT